MEVIKFRGQDLYVGMTPDGTRVVALKPICENVGIAYQSQWAKVKGDPKFSYHDIVTTGADGKNYEMFCLPVSQLNGWLYSINANKVAPEARERLLTYQRECQQVLFQYFMPEGGTIAELYATINLRFGVLEREMADIKSVVRAQGDELEDLRAIAEINYGVGGEKELRDLITYVHENTGMDRRTIVGMLKKTLGISTPYAKAHLKRAKNVLNNMMGLGLIVVK